MCFVLFQLIISKLVPPAPKSLTHAQWTAVQGPPAVSGAADHGTKKTQHSSGCTL